MTVIDRYVFWLFAKIFLVCFASISGLFVVIHLFTNFDDLLRIPDRSNDFPALLVAFYGPRILDFFDRSSSLLTLIAASFALAMMQRHREMIAIESAGICRQRLLFPVFCAAVIVGAAAVWNREQWIPRYREQLVRTAQTWKDDKQKLSYFQKDHLSGLLIKGNALDLTHNTIEEPIVQIPWHISRTMPRIAGKTGTFRGANSYHPAGLHIQQIEEALHSRSGKDLTDGKRTIVYFPEQNGWLGPGECFVATSLTAEDLAFGERLSEYASLRELVQGTSRPSQWYSRGTRIAIHHRIVRPVLDFVLLLVALPLVLSQTENHLWRALAVATLAVVGCQALVYLFTTLGTMGWIPSAALAAWLPLIVLAPLVPWTLRLMRT